MNTNDYDTTLRIIQAVSGYNEAPHDPELSLTDDLGLDSLDVVELVLQLESEFRIEIPSDVDSGWRTVQDVLNSVGAALPETAA